MDAAQRMRAKAEGKGTLKTSPQQKVETRSEGGKEVIMIENADPQVVYVPSYDPVVIYGEPEYPYYPYTYPGWYPGTTSNWTREGHLRQTADASLAPVEFPFFLLHSRRMATALSHMSTR